jgi:hypothetical protein
MGFKKKNDEYILGATSCWWLFFFKMQGANILRKNFKPKVAFNITHNKKKLHTN